MNITHILLSDLFDFFVANFADFCQQNGQFRLCSVHLFYWAEEMSLFFTYFNGCRV